MLPRVSIAIAGLVLFATAASAAPRFTGMELQRTDTESNWRTRSTMLLASGRGHTFWTKVLERVKDPARIASVSIGMRLHPGGYRLDYAIGPWPLTPEIEFELDPAWQAEGGFPPSGRVVKIGAPALFRTVFHYNGPGQPRFAPHTVPAATRGAILRAVGVAFALLTLIFIISEVRVGAFSPGAEVPPYAGAAWIRRYVLERFPQLEQPGGAADDRRVLARMIADRKVAFRMARSADRLDLAILTARDQLSAEERKVVTLLFAERAWTSTRNLRTAATARQKRTRAVKNAVLERRTELEQGIRVLSALLEEPYQKSGWRIADASAYFFDGGPGEWTSRWRRAPLLIFGLAGIAAYVWAGLARTENLLFGGCGGFVLGGVMIVAFVLVALARRFRLPAPALFALLTTLAAAIPAVSMAFFAAQDTVPFTTPLFVTMCLFGLTASDLIFGASATSSGSAERRQALAAAKAAGRNLKTEDSVRAIGLEVTADGFRPVPAAWVMVQLLILFFVINAVGGLWRAFPNVDTIYFILSGVIVGLVTIDRVLALLRARRHPSTALQARPQRSERFAPQFSTPPLTPPAEIRIGPGSGYPFHISGVTHGVTWTVESIHEYRRNGGEPYLEQFTVWRTNAAAIKGVLQFWPRWPEVFTPRPFPEDADFPQFLVTLLLSRLGGSLTDGGLSGVTRLPIDDEQLLTHYKVFSSPDLGAHNISPRLNEVLTNFAGSMHRRPGRISVADDPLLTMTLIMFWPRGLSILCNTSTSDPKMVQALATFGAACANTLRG